MDSVVITLQLCLLLPALPLLVMSRRTSRAHRGRHQSLIAAASLVGLLSAVLALTSLSLMFDDESAADPMLSFVPPLLIIVACLLVVRRGLSAGTRRRSPR